MTNGAPWPMRLQPRVWGDTLDRRSLLHSGRDGIQAGEEGNCECQNARAASIGGPSWREAPERGEGLAG